MTPRLNYHLLRLATLSLGILPALTAPVQAQEHAEEQEGAHAEPPPRHRLALFTGNTWVPQSSHEGAIDGLIAAPTLGLDYAFRLSERFGLSSINDVILDSFVIERDDGSELERELAVVASLVLMWQPAHRLHVFAGPGIEADSHETLGLVKVGFEWELFAAHPWDVALNGAWDIKEEYDVLVVGLSIGRVWR